MSEDARSAASQGLVRLETSDFTSHLVAQLDFEKRRFGRMRRILLTAGRLMVDSFKGRSRWWMVTLTYRDGIAWRAGDITTFTKALRQWLGRHGMQARYVWCLEATQRGRPHYHVMVQLPYGVRMPKPDSQGWWKHGLTQRAIARRAVGYLAKYASKAGRAITWKGARVYGVSGLQSNHRAVLSLWRAPRWVRIASGASDESGVVLEDQITDPVRRVRGGWTWHQTGEFFRSPYIAKFIAGVLTFLKRDELPCAA